MLHVILRYGAVALFGAILTALYLQSRPQGAVQTCFTNLALVDGQLQSGSSELIFSSGTDLMTVVIENNAPNQLMNFFSQPNDGPAEIDPNLIGKVFSVCKTAETLVVSP